MQRSFLAALFVLLSVTVAVRAAGSDVADAVMRGDMAAARALITKGSDVNAHQGDGATALHWAVYRDSVEAVDMLVRAGAKSSPNREGMTPLAMAALFGNLQIVDRPAEVRRRREGARAERRVDGDVRRTQRQSRCDQSAG
jgi:electron transfer flavoprotein alpha/beta subunit